MITLVLAGAIAWAAVAMVVGVVLGKALAHADRRARGGVR